MTGQCCQSFQLTHLAIRDEMWNVSIVSAGLPLLSMKIRWQGSSSFASCRVWLPTAVVPSTVMRIVSTRGTALRPGIRPDEDDTAPRVWLAYCYWQVLDAGTGRLSMNDRWPPTDDAFVTIATAWHVQKLWHRRPGRKFATCRFQGMGCGRSEDDKFFSLSCGNLIDETHCQQVCQSTEQCGSSLTMELWTRRWRSCRPHNDLVFVSLWSSTVATCFGCVARSWIMRALVQACDDMEPLSRVVLDLFTGPLIDLRPWRDCNRILWSRIV